MDKAYGYIYKITSPTNRIYIGKTSNLVNRKRFYENLYCKAQPKLYRSLTKYGWKSHSFEIIDTSNNPTHLNELEIKYIKLYDCFNSGLNCTMGGEGITGFKMSKESKIKMSNKAKGRPSPTKGKIMTDEQKLKISVSKKGKKIKSNKWTENKREIYSKHLNTIHENNKKHILKFDLENNFIKEYSSVQEAALELNTRYNNISRVLAGKRKTLYGYKWKYK